VPNGLVAGPEKVTACAPVYAVSVVTPLVVAVSVTLKATPAVRVPDVGTTVNDGGSGVVAWTPPVGPELHEPTRASTV
jgi:hypothetical protein